MRLILTCFITLLLTPRVEAKISQDILMGAKTLRKAVPVLQSIPEKLKESYQQLGSRKSVIQKGLKRIHTILDPDPKKGMISRTKNFVGSWGWKEDWVSSNVREDIEEALDHLETALGFIKDDLENLLENMQDAAKQENSQVTKVRGKIDKAVHAITKHIKTHLDLPRRMEQLAKDLKNLGQ